MRYIRLPRRRNRHKLTYFRVTSNPQPITMFKLAVFVAILAVAFAAPGGLTGVAISSGLGPITAPQVIAAGPAISHGAVVLAQPIAPAVHTAPVVTRTVLAGHGLGIGIGGLALHG
ncbi:PREDICTED: uncharacterized protein LOC105452486 [Wasmannia auropunctata]|uniref:uncharacterized protein LOC105452486 n=1 Tax=Wasmannia auropunctata TaxID=64793 RepID=UPI0005EDCBA0|nr:PREDICTED: uncharacterized protein LOC105452486 [Wasmannia auropunctata]